MPGLNELLNRKNADGRLGYGTYNALKRKIRESLAPLIWSQRFTHAGSAWTYLFCEPNARRDLSNLSGCVKFIEDTLVAEGVIPDDGPQYVLEIRMGLTHVGPGGWPPGIFVYNSHETIDQRTVVTELMENPTWKKSKSQNPSPSKTTSTPSSRYRGRSSASSKGSRVPTRSGALSALQKARSPKEVQAAKAELKRMGLLSKNSR
jgi:hypothetical protein